MKLLIGWCRWRCSWGTWKWWSISFEHEKLNHELEEDLAKLERALGNDKLLEAFDSPENDEVNNKAEEEEDDGYDDDANVHVEEKEAV